MSSSTTANDCIRTIHYSEDELCSSVSYLLEYSTTSVDQHIAYYPVYTEDQSNVQDSDSISDIDIQNRAREVAEHETLQHQSLPEISPVSEDKQFDISSFALDWFRSIEDEDHHPSQIDESASDAYIEKGPTSTDILSKLQQGFTSFDEYYITLLLVIE